MLSICLAEGEGVLGRCTSCVQLMRIVMRLVLVLFTIIIEVNFRACITQRGF